MDSLTQCPFCGSGWLYEIRRNGYCDETPAMFCNSCKAVVTWEQVEEEGVNDETKTFVREHWNTRAERTCHIEMDKDAPVCSSCGSSMLIRETFELRSWGGDTETMKLVAYPYCPNCGAKVVNK